MNILIIGGGISGISAAKVALKEHHNVTILENAKEPGGLMARIANCRVGFKTFFDEIRDNPLLRVIQDTGIRTAGKRGDTFVITLDDGKEHVFDRVIISTGLTPYDPKELKGKRVLTSLEYDSLIDQRNGDLPDPFQRIAFVLCVGSRGKEYPLCSSVCCSYTLREIKWTLQRAKPDIAVFYNDLRLFGQEFYMEKLYRDMGVKFVRASSRYFDEDDEGVTLRYFSGSALVEDRFDYVVLAIGLRPNPELATLSGQFGFSLNEHGFVQEQDALKTDVKGIYVSGGALEPMGIKDAILTGYGAALRCIREASPEGRPMTDPRIYEEGGPDISFADGTFDSYLFYLATEDQGARMLYEYVTERFIIGARELRKMNKEVTVVTRNMVTPSYGELAYEQARREGVVFVHLEESESLVMNGTSACVTGGERTIEIKAEGIIKFDDYLPLFQGRDFLIQYRSEPQLRWSPTKWGRKRFDVGFIRFPRSERWRDREFFGALGEIAVDEEGARILPEVNDERCSGCGSCKDACPHSAIEMTTKEQQIAVFGPHTVSPIPVAHIKEDTCVSCGLCASTCPSNVIDFDESQELPAHEPGSCLQ